MVMVGASGVADGGRTVLAHVGGLPLTDTTYGSVIDAGLPKRRKLVISLEKTEHRPKSWGGVCGLNIEELLRHCA